MEQQLPTYFLFLIPIAVFVLAQLIKFTRLSLKYGMGLEYLFNPGHMPSAHTAAVTALVITIAYFDSISSSAFFIVFCNSSRTISRSSHGMAFPSFTHIVRSHPLPVISTQSPLCAIPSAFLIASRRSKMRQQFSPSTIFLCCGL